jgi:sulfite exporter TauE/SafE
MNTTLLGTVFVASLAGSLHCAGMCGGFVAFYSASDPGQRGRRYLAHAFYSGGRLVSYLLLGALAGLLGAAVDLAGSLAGVQRVAAVAAGILMVGWGVYALIQALDYPIPNVPLPRLVQRLNARVYGTLKGRPPVVQAMLLGLFSTLLPCGWLYAFALLAAGTGGPWSGMIVMAAFWAGTVPVMLGLGLSLQWLAAPLRRRLPVLTAVALIAVGLLWLVGRTTMPMHASHQQPSVGAVSSDHVH